MNKVFVFVFVTLLVAVCAGYMYLRIGNPLPTPQVIKRHYKLLYRFQQFCQGNGLRYFATAGTLLGAVRDGKMIPWDNDIDLGMVDSQYKKLQTLKSTIRQWGLMLTVHKPGLIKIFFKSDGIDQSLWHRVACLDIFAYQYCDKTNRIVFSNPRFRTTWPGEWYTPDELKKLVWVKFGPLSVPVVTNGDKCCRRQFGQNWKTPQIRTSFRILYPFASQRLLRKCLQSK